MKVKYLGHKPKMPVRLPIGCKGRSAVKQLLWADPYVELADADAQKLVKIDPRNFGIASVDSSAGVEIHEDMPPVKKPGRGRPKKVDAVA